MFVYESVPGSTVENFKETETEVEFTVSAPEDVQFTLELEPEMEYAVTISGTDIGKMKTNLGGRRVLSKEMDPDQSYDVKVVKM